MLPKTMPAMDTAIIFFFKKPAIVVPHINANKCVTNSNSYSTRFNFSYNVLACYDDPQNASTASPPATSTIPPAFCTSGNNPKSSRKIEGNFLERIRAKKKTSTY